MSRWLYTFAVLTPKLHAALRQAPAHEGDAAVHAMVSRGVPIAYYSSLLSGWDSIHGEPSRLVARVFPNLVFEDHGLIYESRPGEDLPCETIDAIVHKLASAQDSLSFQAAVAFCYAVSELHRFAQATGGCGVILAKCVGPTFDDSAFVAELA